MLVSWDPIFLKKDIVVLMISGENQILLYKNNSMINHKRLKINFFFFILFLIFFNFSTNTEEFPTLALS